ncbi:hypothetical protein Salmuc_00811 [Salipiger mucosus DSM 16094]|uniref:Uncharacterized protein n=1 Tax=Salipiger mucosus DSM 16094 TaxID=1123237 RepID=S9S723_9RHOB|nr:hypothetical protein Salmuc_00811 [Salipiger mucosus DSM 16094]
MLRASLPTRMLSVAPPRPSIARRCPRPVQPVAAGCSGDAVVAAAAHEFRDHDRVRGPVRRRAVGGAVVEEVAGRQEVHRRIAQAAVHEHRVAGVSAAVENHVAVGLGDMHEVARGRGPAGEDHRVPHLLIGQLDKAAVEDVTQLDGISVSAAAPVVRPGDDQAIGREIRALRDVDPDGGHVMQGDIREVQPGRALDRDRGVAVVRRQCVRELRRIGRAKSVVHRQALERHVLGKVDLAQGRDIHAELEMHAGLEGHVVAVHVRDPDERAAQRRVGLSPVGVADRVEERVRVGGLDLEPVAGGDLVRPRDHDVPRSERRVGGQRERVAGLGGADADGRSVELLGAEDGLACAGPDNGDVVSGHGERLHQPVDTGGEAQGRAGGRHRRAVGPGTGRAPGLRPGRSGQDHRPRTVDQPENRRDPQVPGAVQARPLGTVQPSEPRPRSWLAALTRAAAIGMRAGSSSRTPPRFSPTPCRRF